MRISMKESFATAPRADINGKPRKIANNTFEYQTDNGERVVRLHITDIITFKPGGKIILDSGGWKTVTTKDRFNNHIGNGWRVYSDKGSWYVVRYGDDIDPAPYFDGMVLPDDYEKPKAKIIDADRALTKDINKFVRLLDDNIPQPSSGDCWLCLMFNQDQKPGAKSHDPNHLREHINEGYMHGALVLSAMRWAGYSDTGIAAHYQMGLTAQFKRTMRRYLKTQLGLAA